MPVFTINPNNSGTVSIALAGVTPLVDYAIQVTDFQIVPSPNLTTRPGTYGVAPSEDPGLSSWGITADFLQDWGNTPSLSQFTLTNDGKLCDFMFKSTNPAVVPDFSGQVKVTATNIGGLPGEAWTAGPFTWSCPGPPTVTASPTALATADA